MGFEGRNGKGNTSKSYVCVCMCALAPCLLFCKHLFMIPQHIPSKILVTESDVFYSKTISEMRPKLKNIFDKRKVKVRRKIDGGHEIFDC